MNYTDLANQLEAQWLSEWTYPAAQIARLMELNAPASIIEEKKHRRLVGNQSHVIYWLKELDKPDADRRAIKKFLNQLGFNLNLKTGKYSYDDLR